MNSRILLGVVMTLVVSMVPASAVAQAAAESALANSASAAATSKTGSALGQGFNRLAGGIGDRLSNTVQTTAANAAAAKPVSTVPPSPPTTAAVPDNTPFVISVQGLGNCPTSSTAKPSSKGSECLTSDKNAAAKTQDKYKSVVNLD